MAMLDCSPICPHLLRGYSNCKLTYSSCKLKLKDCRPPKYSKIYNKSTNVWLKRRTFNLLPIKLYNATISLDCNLRYPPGVVIQDPMPESKAELRELTVAQCIVTADLLGLVPLGVGVGVNVADRRQQISDYLGCAMMFF